MALSVSACPGQPTCWVLDTQAGLGPTPAFRIRRQWTRMPTAPAQCGWATASRRTGFLEEESTC